MKKGFTLIELLAVIAMLAIIALIATPITLGVIEKSRMSSVKISLDNLARAVDLYYEEKELNGTFSPITFVCKNNKCASGTEKLNIETRGIQRGIIDIDIDGNATYYSMLIDGQKCNGINNEVTCEAAEESTVTFPSSEIKITGGGSPVLNNYRIYGSEAGVGDSLESGESGFEIPITIRGKNLFNGRFFSPDNEKWYSETYIKVNVNTPYTFSISKPFNGLIDLSEMKTDGGKTTIRIAPPYSIVTSPTAFSLDFVVYYSSSKPQNIQIEKGSVVTEYEPYVEPVNYIIKVSSPLLEEEYIDFETQKVVRKDGTEESIKLPIIHLLDVETNILEVNTTNKPSEIEVTYIK